MKVLPEGLALLLLFIGEHPLLSGGQLARCFGVRVRDIQPRLKALYNRGLIDQIRKLHPKHDPLYRASLAGLHQIGEKRLLAPQYLEMIGLAGDVPLEERKRHWDHDCTVNDLMSRAVGDAHVLNAHGRHLHVDWTPTCLLDDLFAGTRKVYFDAVLTIHDGFPEPKTVVRWGVEFATGSYDVPKEGSVDENPQTYQLRDRLRFLRQRPIEWPGKGRPVWLPRYPWMGLLVIARGEAAFDGVRRAFESASRNVDLDAAEPNVLFALESAIERYGVLPRPAAFWPQRRTDFTVSPLDYMAWMLLKPARLKSLWTYPLLLDRCV